MSHVRDVFEEFKRLCYLSEESYVPTKSNIRRWEDRITFMKANQEFQRKNAVTITKDVTSFLNAAKKRTFKTFSEIPDYIKRKINKCVNTILKSYPKTKQIYLTGSYSKGEYIDAFTDDDFITLKQGVKTVKYSDFDFILEPFVLSSDLEDIDLLYDRGERKILVWTKKKKIK